MDVLAREERLLAEQLEKEEITITEYNRQLDEIHTMYRQHAHEAAQKAYNEELERW